MRALSVSAVEAAPRLLAAILRVSSPEGAVAVRITEVEAYLGVGEDPGSHAHRGPTPRVRSMFGEPGRLYAYFAYGMHVCANIVCHEPGGAGAVLLRAGEVVEGVDLARLRRASAVRDRDLARGPARLATALGLALSDDGAPLDGGGRLELSLPGPGVTAALQEEGHILTSPRTGVSGEGGGDAYPWRFWIHGEQTVSPYRTHRPRRAGGGSGASRADG